MITRDTYQAFASYEHVPVWGSGGYKMSDKPHGKAPVTVTDIRLFGVLIYRHRKHLKAPAQTSN